MTGWEIVLSSGAVVAVVNAIFALVNRFLDKRDKSKSALDDVLAKLGSISDRLDSHIADDDERFAVQCRRTILRFNDEIMHGEQHSREHFEDVMISIQDYNDYCARHPDFQNGITEPASRNITGTYERCMREKTFL